MRTKTNFLIGCALLAAGALSGCGPAAAPKPNIEHMLATAKTASDHEAIAEYYENEAADAHAKYKQHQAEAVRYEAVAKWKHWSWHCAQLAQDFKQAEEDASVLAAQHRKIAQETKSGAEIPTAPPAPGPSAKQTQ